MWQSIFYTSENEKEAGATTDVRPLSTELWLKLYVPNENRTYVDVDVDVDVDVCLYL